jgi:Ca2+-binding RTX toxin-like protein
MNLSIGSLDGVNYRARIESEINALQPNSNFDSLNAIMSEAVSFRYTSGGTPYPNHGANRSSFTLTNDEMEGVFAIIMENGDFESKVDNWSLVDIPESKERAVLVSLSYNENPSNPLLGPSLKTAIEQGNRSWAWFEIRYGSNSTPSTWDDIGANGTAKRRFAESALFGLYNDFQNVSFEEALQTFEVFSDQARRTRIIAYEQRFGDYLGSSKNTNMRQDSSQIYPALTFSNAVAPAKQELLDTYGPQIFDGVSSSDYLFHDLNIQIGSELGDTTSGTAISSDINNGQGELTNNLIIARDGNDTLDGGVGNDIIWGEQGDDNISGGVGEDILIGGSGIDTLHGGSDNDHLFGGTEKDYLYGEDGVDYLYGEEGDDELNGGANNDFVYGGEGSDQIHGSLGDDFLDGGEGGDTYTFNKGDEIERITDTGLNGIDTLEINGYALNEISIRADGLSTTINFDASSDQIFVDGNSIERYLIDGVLVEKKDFLTVTGTVGNDSLQALEADGFSVVDGGSGDDTIFAAQTVDSELYGGEGRDVFYINNWNSASLGLNHQAFGGDGNDKFWVFGGNNQIYGGAGRNTFYLNSSFNQEMLGTTYAYGGNEGNSFDVNGSDVIAYGGSQQDSFTVVGGTLYAEAGSGDVYDVLRISEDADNATVFFNGQGGSDIVWASLISTGTIDYTVYLDMNSGSDRVSYSDTNAGFFSEHINNQETGRIEFSSEYQLSDLSIYRSGGHLIAQSLIDDTSVEVQHNYLNGVSRVDEIIVGSTVIDISGLNSITAKNIYQGSSSSEVVDGRSFENWDVFSGDGNDQILASNNVNIYSGNGDDYISAGSNAYIWSDEGKDTINVNTNSNLVINHSFIASGAGDDLVQTNGFTSVRLEGGDDYLYDNGLAAVDGGEGNDIIINATSAYYRPGDGNDVYQGLSRLYIVNDTGDLTTDSVQFKRTSKDLIITISGSSDFITIDGYFIYDSYRLQSISLIDGDFDTSQAHYSWNTVPIPEDNSISMVAENLSPYLIAGGSFDDTLHGLMKDTVISGGDGQDTLRGSDGNDTLHGGDDDDHLFGSDGNDELYGGGDDDELYGGAGKDTLDGGEGDNDELNGGLGDDVFQNSVGNTSYNYVLGDGHDRISDIGGLDKLNLGYWGQYVEISTTDVKRSGDDLVLDINQNDSVVIENWFSDINNQIETITFFGSDNILHEYSASEIDSMVVGFSNAPPTGGVIITGTATEDQTLTASNTLGDTDGLGSISYQWQRDGLDIIGATDVTYILGDSDVSTAITVVASYIDSYGTYESIVSAETPLIANINDAPSIDGGVSSMSTVEDMSFSFGIPSDAFTDLDGDSLTYTATLAGGLALPDWLDFDGQVFVGIPTNDNVGNIEIEITANDGLSIVSTTFDLAVTNVNDAPTLVIDLPDANTNENEYLSFTLPEGSFNDVDAGDSLTYNATLSDGSALPAWLTFDSQSQTFSGTPGSDDVGVSGVRVEVTDLDGLVASDEFNLNVERVVDQPISITGTGSAEIFEGGNADDYINAKGGADQLYGFEGNDTLIGGGGSDYLYGGTGNDVIKGGNGADHLYGGEGNDTLVGNKGNDTYHFSQGDDYDKINNASNKFDSETDILSLEGEITEADIWFKKTNNHLDVYLLGSDDHIRVNNWYKADKYELDRIDTGSSSIDAAGIEQLVSAMASFGSPTAGGEIVLTAEERSQLDASIAVAWQ